MGASAECTALRCVCGGCAKLRSGVNCGYIGTCGHWSCCFSSDPVEMRCMTTHIGFWHAECDWSQGCDTNTCYCDNCGHGCAYIGRLAHWSCCLNERFESICARNSSQPRASLSLPL